MALPADFDKIFGSTFTGGLVPISDVNYSKGWEYVGSNPPTKNDFSYLQNFSDLKSQWLYARLIGVNQTWQDVLASRAVGVTYTNSTGKPIMISIATIVNTATPQSTLIASGIPIGSVAVSGLPAGQSYRGQLSAVIPNNGTYLISSSAQILQWGELR